MCRSVVREEGQYDDRKCHVGIRDRMLCGCSGSDSRRSAAWSRWDALADEFREYVDLALERDQERAAVALELFAQLAEADRKPHPGCRFTVLHGGKADDQGPDGAD
jgi:hypothetical protein